MSGRYRLVALVGASWTALASLAAGQITSLADDILLLSKGVQTQQQTTVDYGPNSLGPSPGSGAPLFGRSAPRATESTGNRPKCDVLQAISTEGQRRPPEQLPFRPPQTIPAQPQPPFQGALELPEGSDDGPANGLSLDAAIERLVQQNYVLRAKGHEIPKARADVLTASLRANPLVFATVSSVPYGNYSPQRPGETSYSATVIYPLDVSHKRLARTESANHARGVIEAQYQDAVRLEIDKLYVAFLEVVAARETLRFARANVDGLGRTMRIAKIQLDNQQIAPLDLDRLGLQMDAAELGVEQATISLRETKHSLGLLLAMPIEEAERTELRGAFRDTAPPPPNERELFTLALSIRPDLNAYRLGVQRAESDVRLAEAERVSDLFLLYSPFELRNNGPTGGQNATSWSLAAFSSVPLFNRNQGNIRRAQVNVSQTRTELTGLEQEIVEETHHAYTEYLASRNVVDRLEKTVLPRSRRIRDTVANLLNQGQASTLEFLSAQREHNDVVRQYRDALIRHRRSMLKLNTALGERLLP